MAGINYTKSIKIYLEKEEAEALFTTGINNECPSGFFSPLRKVWWIIEDDQGNLPYTLCQTCYHENSFGEANDSVKEMLQPVMMQGIPCCCEGVKHNDAFPINYDDYKIGIYKIQPVTTLMKGTIENNTITVLTSDEMFSYAISIVCPNLDINDVDQFECKMFDNNNISESVMYTSPTFVNGSTASDYRIDIIGVVNNETHSLTSNKFIMTENPEITKRIQLIFEDNLLVEFKVIIKYINDEKSNNEYSEVDINNEDDKIVTVNI